jgi:hypothetical protein
MLLLRVRPVTGLLLLALTLRPAASGAASDVDLLIDALVAKGLFTAEEATALVADMRARKSPVPFEDLAPSRAPPVAAASDADRLRVKGDLRIRYQTDDLDHLPAEPPIAVDERDRYRIRWRLGVDTDVNERWTVGFGLASGGSDSRSTNQTLTNAFATGDARLDYAYARWQARDDVEALAGKFINPLWEPKDLLWDTDIRPDGFAARYRFAPAGGVDAFVTPAYLVLAEKFVEVQSDAALWALQAGATFALGERTSFTLAPTYYGFQNTRGSIGPVVAVPRSNSRDGAGNLLYDYDAASVAAALTLNDLGRLPQVQVFGEWVRAFDPNEEDTGWLAGATLGAAKVARFGDWQFAYNYRRLDRDAWPEFLGDSESFFGATNFEGNEVEFALGLAKNVSLALDYYSNVEFRGTGIEQDVLFVDLNLKW